MGIRVLVVDDDKDLLTLIERYLVKEHQGFEVTSTISAQDAVRKLEEEHFDVIVCDYYLGVGEMNGLELLEWLRASQSSIPFIMFTGRSREEVAIRALNLGANLYLKKDQEDLGNLFVELVHHIKSSVESTQMEEALRQSELRYHDLLMALPGGIGITDLDENFTYVNQSFSDMLGYSVEDLVQKNVLDLTPADDHRIVKAETERRKRYVTSTYDLQMIRKDGEIRQFNISTLPQKDDEGNVIGTIGVVSDITERKRSEKALKASEQLLKSTFDSLSEAILVIETDTEEIVNCNPAAETVFGYSRHEMLGLKIGMLHVNQTTQGEFEGNLYSAIEENGILDQFEFRMKRSDGTVFPTEHSVTPLRNEQGTRVGWVTVIHDITENKLRISWRRKHCERARFGIVPYSTIHLLD
jgi:PAS domain S-box-containing protein